MLNKDIFLVQYMLSAVILKKIHEKLFYHYAFYFFKILYCLRFSNDRQLQNKFQI